MSKKVLIFYTSIGWGHKSMAENIGYHLRLNGHEVHLWDIHKVQTGKLVTISTAFYKWWIATLPGLWRWFYLSKIWSDLTLRFRLPLASKHHEDAQRLIQEVNPDLVIAVQTTASAVVSYLKLRGLYAGKFAIGFSDFHLHRYWLYDQADFYLANIEEQKQEMIRLGIPEEKICVVGMTLKPQPSYNKDELKQKYGVSPQSKVILISGGSMGFGLTRRMIRSVRDKLDVEFGADFRLIVVCGNNKDLYNDLNPFGDDRVVIYGYFEPLSELYAIADILVGKPGGLTTTEVLHYRVPIIVTHWLPGGEELNVRYLSDHKYIMPVDIKKPKSTDTLMIDMINELKNQTLKKSLESRPEEISKLVNTDPQRIGNEVTKRVN